MIFLFCNLIGLQYFCSARFGVCFVRLGSWGGVEQGAILLPIALGRWGWGCHPAGLITTTVGEANHLCGLQLCLVVLKVLGLSLLPGGPERTSCLLRQSWRAYTSQELEVLMPINERNTNPLVMVSDS